MLTSRPTESSSHPHGGLVQMAVRLLHLYKVLSSYRWNLSHRLYLNPHI